MSDIKGTQPENLQSIGSIDTKKSQYENLQSFQSLSTSQYYASLNISACLQHYEAKRDLYVANSLIRNIINLVALDAIRNGIEIINDEKTDELDNFLKQNNIIEVIHKAIINMRIYGIAYIVLTFSDTQEPEQWKQKVSNNTELLSFKVLDYDLIPIYTAQTGHKDVQDLIFQIGAGGASITYEQPLFAQIHSSRLIILEDSKTFQDNSWNERKSDLDLLYQATGNYNKAIESLSTILKRHGIPVLSIDGLFRMVETTPNATGVENRLYAFNHLMDTQSILLKDKDREEFEFLNSSLSGIKDVINELKEYLSMVSNIPLMRLFGMMPKGLSGDGSSHYKLYNDYVKTKQKVVEHGLNKIPALLGMSSDIVININDSFTISEEERVDIQTKKVDILMKLSDMVDFDPDPIQKEKIQNAVARILEKL